MDLQGIVASVTIVLITAASFDNAHLLGFCRVLYWGKIQGQTADYFIAEGIGRHRKPEEVESEGKVGTVIIAEHFESKKSIVKNFFRIGYGPFVFL